VTALIELRELAEQGFSAVRPSELGQVGERAWDHGETSGDARYCSLGRTVLLIHEWWVEHDEQGGVPVSVASALEALLMSRLPGILNAPLASDAAPLARTLREDVEAHLTDPQDWISGGHAHSVSLVNTRPRVETVRLTRTSKMAGVVARRHRGARRRGYRMHQSS
jgi:hypothetical protein